MAGAPGPPPLSAAGPRTSLAPGTVLLGRFRVEGYLASGGAADVFLAGALDDGARVVVKVPEPGCLRRAAERARFRREVDHLARVAHPHVVRVLAAGEAEGTPFVVLEHLAGGSLADRFRADPPGRDLEHDLAALRGWLPSVASALDAIHGVGVVHRDVKPSNVLFDDAGRAHLADFGLSKALHGESSLTPRGFAVGTPEYLAPEQVRDDPVGPAADQYALATLVFEAVAGRPPFPRASLGRLLLAKVREPAPSLRDAAAGVPSPLAVAVARGLATDAAARFPSCGALADACLAPA